jgi:hypothetical protein
LQISLRILALHRTNKGTQVRKRQKSHNSVCYWIPCTEPNEKQKEKDKQGFASLTN